MKKFQTGNTVLLFYSYLRFPLIQCRLYIIALFIMPYRSNLIFIAFCSPGERAHSVIFYLLVALVAKVDNVNVLYGYAYLSR